MVYNIYSNISSLSCISLGIELEGIYLKTRLDNIK